MTVPDGRSEGPEPVVSASLDHEVRQVLAGLDLSASASGLLWMLDPARPPLRLREIARALDCDPSNVTLIGDKLQRAGLVTRQAHPDDRRSRVLALTPAGRRLRERLLDFVVPRADAIYPLGRNQVDYIRRRWATRADVRFIPQHVDAEFYQPCG